MSKQTQSAIDRFISADVSFAGENISGIVKKMRVSLRFQKMTITALTETIGSLRGQIAALTDSAKPDTRRAAEAIEAAEASTPCDCPECSKEAGKQGESSVSDIHIEIRGKRPSPDSIDRAVAAFVEALNK